MPIFWETGFLTKIISLQDCHPRQVYVADECRCACPNGAEEDACLARSDLHEWSRDTCSCRCKEEAAASAECSTGMVFDVGECRC